MFLVSNLRNSVTVPDKTPLLHVTVSGQDQRFETFTVKAGEDTSEEILDQDDIAPRMAHGRAALYHTWPLRSKNGRISEARDYYTTFMFHTPFQARHISITPIKTEEFRLPPGVIIHLKEIWLLY